MGRNYAADHSFPQFYNVAAFMKGKCALKNYFVNPVWFILRIETGSE
jgi:hypothetical protein